MTDESPKEERKPRILVVDDSRVMRRAVSKILGDSYDVIEAEHGEDAWTLLTNDDTIQVVFSDLSMPYLDGFGLLAKIRSSDKRRLQELPVIIITGKEDDEDTKQDALSKGASDFITKPFDSVQLRARAKAHVTFEQTARKLSETSASLEMEAAIDGVTGLGSKLYFMKSANENLAYAKRHGNRLIMVRMDIDRFNELFIKHGKAAADAMLERVGRILLRSIRQEDKAARLGLASFACLLQSTMLEGAMHLAERIRQEIAHDTFTHGTHQMKVTVSIGVAEPLIRQNTTVEDIVKAAEVHLTQASRAGGNRLAADTAAPPPAAPSTTERKSAPSLETALAMLDEGKAGELAAFAPTLLARLLPLLEYLAQHAGGEAKALVKALRQRQDPSPSRPHDN